MIDRTDPAYDAGEATQLYGYLDYHRATLLMKTEGLTAEQLALTHPPSTMTLGGMLKHTALNEDNWFSVFLLGNGYAEPWASVDWEADNDWDWHSAADDDPDELRNLYTSTVDRVRGLVEDIPLDQMSVKRLRSSDQPVNLRWIVLHMIEEYARHNGHADLIRESIDGSVGE
jgi:uncharacterized damage-inducible protein DinB